ncbi:MAG TPA: outer membrane lipid asymmetry maintenance protein MlaD [Steroidobacteraceae bacterium]|nr:outer membrane lipid asymmetry maintenance protein MlaD [Steroidobacteraceae bacterium]
MRQSRAIDLSTGLFVMLGFAALFFMVTQITSRGIVWHEHDYRLTALFDNVGGLKVGAPVSIGGVTVGRVESIDYDIKSYKAVVKLIVQSRYDKIPQDSDVAIYTAGLLGGQYIGLTPGGSETYFKDGDQIELTQSAVVLENLISKFLFDKAGQGESKKSEGAAK